ncbi:MAG: hypothetical protein KBT27_11395 [Prevotellaceae bacterium]|nr:hypothetical protein [Candidatus Faecinaster equi]
MSNESEDRRGMRKDQCQNCLFSSSVTVNQFGRFVTCQCQENKRYFRNLLPMTKPTCSYVRWKPVNRSVMVGHDKDDMYLTKRGMWGKDK